jgi:hypothetical protein
MLIVAGEAGHETFANDAKAYLCKRKIILPAYETFWPPKRSHDMIKKVTIMVTYVKNYSFFSSEGSSLGASAICFTASSCAFCCSS